MGKCFQAVVGALNASTSLSQCQLFVRDFVVTQLIGKDLNEIWEVSNTATICNCGGLEQIYENNTKKYNYLKIIIIIIPSKKLILKIRINQIENPMEAMQDILGRSGRGEPEPRLIFESGKNTLEAVYHVGIYSDKEFIGSGK